MFERKESKMEEVQQKSLLCTIAGKKSSPAIAREQGKGPPRIKFPDEKDRENHVSSTFARVNLYT